MTSVLQLNIRSICTRLWLMSSFCGKFVYYKFFHLGQFIFKYIMTNTVNKMLYLKLFREVVFINKNKKCKPNKSFIDINELNQLFFLMINSNITI